MKLIKKNYLVESEKEGINYRFKSECEPSGWFEEFTLSTIGQRWSENYRNKRLLTVTNRDGECEIKFRNGKKIEIGFSELAELRFTLEFIHRSNPSWFEKVRFWRKTSAK